jgi:FMN phosphatase YigB (HAD superfamily)
MADERPPVEPLTPEELERFLAQARAQGRLLTAEERAQIFGNSQSASATTPVEPAVSDMKAARLTPSELAQLQQNFFPELGEPETVRTPRLVQGIIFDFDDTLAELTRPLDELMAIGAQAADAYMRSTGMNLPDDFWPNIIEARRFAEEKSEQEMEEHIADDALSFLLQFFDYPASKLDRAVLTQAVDIFYAPEMTAWRLLPGSIETLQSLQAAGYRLALLANHSCDRVFQRTVDYLGLRPYLDLCLSSAGVEFRKPDVRFLEIAIDRWEALPYEVVVVGDSLRHDIQAGLDLGAMTIQMMCTATPQVAHENQQLTGQVVPDAVITELHEVPTLIHTWANA